MPFECCGRLMSDDLDKNSAKAGHAAAEIAAYLPHTEWVSSRLERPSMLSAWTCNRWWQMVVRIGMRGGVIRRRTQLPNGYVSGNPSSRVSIADPKFGCAEGTAGRLGRNSDPLCRWGIAFQSARYVACCAARWWPQSWPSILAERALPKVPANPLRTQHLGVPNALACNALTCSLVPPVRVELTMDGF